MRNTFFEKGEEVRHPLGYPFILATNKVDGKTYALERIQNAPQKYVYQTYSQYTHQYFLQYFTCWAEMETIVKEKPKQEKKQSFLGKKKTLSSFLQKKNKNDDVLSIRNHNQKAFEQKKTQPQKKQEEKEDISVLYVQFQAFLPLELPRTVQETYILMAVIYFQAQQVYKQLGIWPSMIPVLNQERKMKFIQKGKSRNFQLKSLLFFCTGNFKLGEWTGDLMEAKKQFDLSEDLTSLGEAIHEFLMKIIRAKHQIKVSKQKEIREERALLSIQGILTLEKEESELPLEEYTINYSKKSDKIRQITLAHPFFASVTIYANSQSFIAKYLKQLKVP